MPASVMVALALRTLSTSSARRSTKPSSASAKEMRLTQVPECGKISTRSSSASRCRASRTGVRDTSKRAQMSFSEIAEPGAISSRTMPRRRNSYI